MRRWVHRLYLRFASWLKSEAWRFATLQREAQALKSALEGKLTDKAVEVLLYVMEVAFVLMPDYRRNLRGFRGSYVLRTANGDVAASAVFARQKMSVRRKAIASPTVAITFKSPQALRRFLSSKDRDILQALLANDVEVDGNVNYVYKLGFMAKDLTRRLGLS